MTLQLWRLLGDAVTDNAAQGFRNEAYNYRLGPRVMISVTRQVLLILDYLILRFEYDTEYDSKIRSQVPVRIQTTV